MFIIWLFVSLSIASSASVDVTDGRGSCNLFVVIVISCDRNCLWILEQDFDSNIVVFPLFRRNPSMDESGVDLSYDESRAAARMTGVQAPRGPGPSERIRVVVGSRQAPSRYLGSGILLNFPINCLIII